MKDILQAKIDALKADYESVKASYEARIADEEAKLKSFLEEIPAELHNLEASAWEKIKGWLAKL